METMNDYTTYCTKEQTERAFKLGAPIEKDYSVHHAVKSVQIRPEHGGSFYATIPTTQQLLGWLMEKGLFMEQTKGFLYYFKIYYNFNCIDELCDENYNIGVNNAIDVALTYLEKGE